MANNAAETLIGAMVVATAAGFLIYAGTGQSFGSSDSRIEYNARFYSAEGLSVGSEVHLAGVQIGTVTAMTLDRLTYQAVTIFAIDDDIALPDDTEAKVASEGLLGGTFLELTPGGSDVMLSAGEEVIYTQGAVSLINLLLKFVSGTDE